MKLNNVQGQAFGATPNKILRNYIKTALVNSDNNTQMRILDNYKVMKDMFGAKQLSMKENAKKITAVELNGAYLTDINKADSVVTNLEKIVKALEGRKAYSDYYNCVNAKGVESLPIKSKMKFLINIFKK